MPRGIDRPHPRQAEVPLQFRGAKGCQEAAAGAVHVDRYVQPGLALQLVKRLGHCRHGLVASGKGDPQGGHHADGVLVAQFEHFLRGHQQAVPIHGNFPVLHIPVAGELVPADLHRPGDEIGLVDGLALGLAPGLPAPLHGHAPQHGCLAGTGSRAADGVLARRGVPQVGQHVHATGFDFRYLWVLVLVDDILVDTLVHQAMHLGLLPGLAEGGEVLAGVAVEHQLVVHHRVGVARLLLLPRELEPGHTDAEITRCVDIVFQPVPDGVFVVQGHTGSSRLGDHSDGTTHSDQRQIHPCAALVARLRWLTAR